VTSGHELRSFTGHASYVSSVAFSPDGKLALSGSGDSTLRLWDVAGGLELRSFVGHAGWITSVGFSPDGKRIASGGHDGTMRLWSVQSGEELAATIASEDGNYVAITKEGFFSASMRDTDMLAVVRGVEDATIGQVHQSPFNPDLVREALAGDLGGDLKRAAEVINLEKVLDSGPAPEVQITSYAQGDKSDTDLVTITARVRDRGKGIGRVEWRVNGITVGVQNAPANVGATYEVARELALDPAENAIDVVAYNANNLLASLPAQTTIAYTGPTDKVTPKLHVLAIGINAYRGDVPKLNLAVPDARAFAAEMRKAGVGLYSDVRARTVLDEEATAEGLDRIVDEFSAGIAPRDTFVLYVAAHGYSEVGRFYLIPQDYAGGTDPAALTRRAIGQERLQDWIANRIKAKKVIILLDTCESGALVNGYEQSRFQAAASEAALGRLHEATGRPVLTAATAGQSAFELDKLGHGAFTYALIDALHHGDRNGDGLIEVSELADHVESLVPKLVAGGEARAAIARGPTKATQSAHFGSTGGDFALVKRLP